MTILNWQLADAKNRLSEVVRRALQDGPQRITRRSEAVVVLSEAEYERLAGKKLSLAEQFMSGPTLQDLDLTRDKSPMRNTGV